MSAWTKQPRQVLLPALLMLVSGCGPTEEEKLAKKRADIQRGKELIVMLQDKKNLNLEMVELLLDTGVDASVTDEDGTPILLFAVASGHVEIAEVLLDAGADPNASGHHGTALATALRLKKTHTGQKAELIELLLDAGAKPDNDALINAARGGGGVRITTLLLDAGADLNAVNSSGWTALMAAAETGDAELVGALLKAGANPNAQNQIGRTPLMMAAHDGHSEIVSLLLDANVDINAVDMHGFSALHSAVHGGRLKIAHQLKDAGANPL